MHDNTLATTSTIGAMATASIVTATTAEDIDVKI